MKKRLMATTSQLTLDDFLALPEVKPGYEYIEGEVAQKAMPNIFHGFIQALLGKVLGGYILDNNLGIFGSEIRCVFRLPDRNRVLLPDFLFLSWQRLADVDWRGAFPGGPDLVVEIISPDDRARDVRDKADFYLAHDVRVVWLIDPDQRTLMVRTGADRPLTLREGDTLDGGEFLPGFVCRIADLLPSPPR